MIAQYICIIMFKREYKMSPLKKGRGKPRPYKIPYRIKTNPVARTIMMKIGTAI